MIIRCRSKTDLSRYHEITVSGPNRVSCSGGRVFCARADAEIDFCAHIDAVINYGLKAVVHPDDQHLVESACTLAGPIEPSLGWRAAWMKDGVWISGRTARIRGHAAQRLPTDKPGVCFSGTDPQRERSELAREAEAAGWAFTRNVTSLTQVLVLADKTSTVKKARKALQAGIPVFDYEEWRNEIATPTWTRG